MRHLILFLLLMAPALAQTSPAYQKDALAVVKAMHQALDSTKTGDLTSSEKATAALAAAQKDFTNKYKGYKVSGAQPPSLMGVNMAALDVSLAVVKKFNASTEKDPAKRKALLDAVPACDNEIKTLTTLIVKGQ